VRKSSVNSCGSRSHESPARRIATDTGLDQWLHCEYYAIILGFQHSRTRKIPPNLYQGRFSNESSCLAVQLCTK
jgi:hypothetical protein